MNNPNEDNQSIGVVLSSSPNSIVVEIAELGTFVDAKESLQIGDYVKIRNSNITHTIAIITDVHGENGKTEDVDEPITWRFIINCQPIGTLNDDNVFIKGSSIIPLPTELVYILHEDVLSNIFSKENGFDFYLGKLSTNTDVSVNLNGDNFFGKHIGIVGSTGSGKSCAVAKILHQAVGITPHATNKNTEKQRNSHIVIFDIHAEYKSAFTLKNEQNFTLNTLSVETLALPYWLMNSEELESIFIETKETNAHNQISQFKQAVILNKEKHNPHLRNITYDMPCYFSIQEVYHYIYNLNSELVEKTSGKPHLLDGGTIDSHKRAYFDQKIKFAEPDGKNTGNRQGPFYAEFNRFIPRLETKLADKRLQFLIAPKKQDGTEYKTNDFSKIVQQYLGYLNTANVTIIDLSGIPFEVLSITISLISRLVFDFCFHYTKLQGKNTPDKENSLNNIPVMIVCEEAHNYIPQNDGAEYKASRKSIERIAKEGRKYGLSLMIVSQRPSEVSETVFAQCSNFIALRLTNNNDQAYIKRLMPNNSTAITDILPNLSDGECVVVGSAVLIPSIVKMEMPNPQPQSQNVKVHQEWQKEWQKVSFQEVIAQWRKEVIENPPTPE